MLSMYKSKQTRMIKKEFKNSKGKQGLSLIVLQKVRKQGIRFWDERTFWHEMIYKSLIPTFDSLQYIGLPKVVIKLL